MAIFVEAAREDVLRIDGVRQVLDFEDRIAAGGEQQRVSRPDRKKHDHDP